MPGYKGKTIKAVLTKKVNTWLETITDPSVRDLVKSNTIITGGAIVSMLQGEEVNDFDVYFRNYDTVLAVANYYVEKFRESHGEGKYQLSVNPDWQFNPRTADGLVGAALQDTKNKRVKIIAKSVGVTGEENGEGELKYFESKDGDSEYIAQVLDNPLDIEDAHEDTQLELQKNPEEKKFRPVFLSSNAITLSDKVQIVLRFYGEPDEIHQNYDFVHCTSYWTSWDDKLVLRPEALESILSKELRYVGSKYPICSLIRLRKFITRGWRVNAGQVLKMAFQVSELDLTDIQVLEDQLTGVDTAYFSQLINILKSAEDKGDKMLNAAYVVEIVDRMF